MTQKLSIIIFPGIVLSIHCPSKFFSKGLFLWNRNAHLCNQKWEAGLSCTTTYLNAAFNRLSPPDLVFQCDTLNMAVKFLADWGLKKYTWPFTWTLNKLAAAFFFQSTDIFLYVSSVISEWSDSHYTWYTHQDYYLDQRPKAHCSRHVILYNVCHVNCVGLSIQQLTELGSQALLNNHVRSDDNCTTS